MVTGIIHNHEAKVRSFRIAAGVLSELCEQPAAA
jgi:hypothetical protein